VLHLLSPPRARASSAPSGADLGLLLWLLAVALVPVAGILLGAPFGSSEAGAGAAVALLAGREGVTTARALWRSRRA
jgi:hypothetical protein